MPYASKSYPWDQSCDILPYFREKSKSQSRSCYHCLKGQLKDHFSCQIIDQIFQKKTQKCQCEVLSEESSEISFGPFHENSDDNENVNDDKNKSWEREFRRKIIGVCVLTVLTNERVGLEANDQSPAWKYSTRTPLKDCSKLYL